VIFELINKYTRVTNNSHTTNDHIFLKNRDSNIEPIILKSYITDHYSILLIGTDNIKNNQEANNIKLNINIKLFNSFLINEKW